MEIRCSSPDDYDVMQETSNCLKISFIKKKKRLSIEDVS